MVLRRSTVLLFASATLLAAAAQAQERQRSDAERLFEEGRALFQEKRFAQACTKLSESDRAEPSVGTRGLLAACHEQIGKLATAQREYVETAELARRAGDAREAFARDRAQALEARVPRLAVQRAEGVPADAVLLIDGATS